MDIFFDLLMVVIVLMTSICVTAFFGFQMFFWQDKKYGFLYTLILGFCWFIIAGWIIQGRFASYWCSVPIVACVILLAQFVAFKQQWQKIHDIFWEPSARGKIALLYLCLFLSFAGVRAVYYWQDNYYWLNSVPCVVTELQTKIGEMEDSYDDGSPTGKMLATKELYLYARPLSSDTTPMKLRLKRIVARNPVQSADELQVSCPHKVGDTINVYNNIIVGKP